MVHSYALYESSEVLCAEPSWLHKIESDNGSQGIKMMELYIVSHVVKIIICMQVVCEHTMFCLPLFSFSFSSLSLLLACLQSVSCHSE